MMSSHSGQNPAGMDSSGEHGGGYYVLLTKIVDGSKRCGKTLSGRGKKAFWRVHMVLCCGSAVDVSLTKE